MHQQDLQQLFQQQSKAEVVQETSQLLVHEIQKSDSMGELSVLKEAVESGIKLEDSGVHKQYFSAVIRSKICHQQLKDGASFPVSFSKPEFNLNWV